MSLAADKIIAKASVHRQQLTFPFIAITGSNGKTTTKRMIRAIFEPAGRLYDFDYHSDTAILIAQELLQLPNTYDWAVVKLGAVEPKAIQISAALIQPTVGIVTNIGEAHLRTHGSVEGIAASKQWLIKSIPPEGAIILNRDNEYTRKMGEGFKGKVIYFGLNEVCDFCATNIEHLGTEGTALTVCRHQGASLRLHLPIFSLGDVYNALAAIATADFFHISDEMIISGLEKRFRLPDGRGVLHICANNIRILDDTYDATPQSLMKSTKSLLSFRDGSNRLILIMGDMAELGRQSKTMHRMMGHYLAGMPIDLILLIGKAIRFTEKAILEHSRGKKSVFSFPNMAAAKKWLLGQLQANDTVLVEGSDKEDLSGLVTFLLDRFQPALAPSEEMFKS